MKESINTKVIDSLTGLFNKKTIKNIKDIKIFDEELKVVDIDVSTITEQDITKDGYIIDEMGNVKRLSDEAVLFLRKIFPKANVAAYRYINTLKYINDEMKVVDVDLSTIELRNIHKDGYYFEKDGNVRKISDEAILFLRRMFPNSVIAENRLQSVKEYKDLTEVESLDLSTIDLNNVDMDGYFLNEDGIVKRLSDDAILFLRRIYKNSRIAFNRTIEQRKDNNSVKLVRDNKKHFVLNINVVTKGKELFTKVKEASVISGKAISHGISNVATSVSSKASSVKNAVLDKKPILSGKIKVGLTNVKDAVVAKKHSLLQGIKNVKTNIGEKASSIKNASVKKKSVLSGKIKIGLTNVKDAAVAKKDSLLQGVKNIAINVGKGLSLLKNKIVFEKKPIASKRIKVELSNVKNSLVNKKKSFIEKKNGLLASIRKIGINLKNRLLVSNKKYSVQKKTIFAKRVKDDLTELQKTVSRVKINDLKEKESLVNRIKNLKVDFKNSLKVLKKKIKLVNKPVFAKRVSCLVPKRELKEGLRPEELKIVSFSDKVTNFKYNARNKVALFKKHMALKNRAAYAKTNKVVPSGRVLVDGIRPESFTDKVNNLKVNVSSNVIALKKKAVMANRPSFAKNEFTGETLGLRDFKSGIRPVKNMGDLNMLERMTTYIKNMGKPSYAIKVQNLDNSVKRYKLEREPLFKSSYILSNLKLMGRKLTGIGGVVALSSSMMSGLSSSAVADTAVDYIDNDTAISVFKEYDKDLYSGVIELKDEDDEDLSFIQGILLDEQADKSLADFSNGYIDDYDIDPLSVGQDEGDGLVAGMYLEAAEEEASENLYFDHVSDKVTSNQEPDLYLDEEYVSYAMYNVPYTEVHALDEGLTREIIENYSNIYNVNSDVVYNKLAELTDNFTSDDYINNKTINGVTCKGKQVYANSYEELLMLAVRSIAQLPNRFGINYKELHNCDYYTSSDDYATQISHIAKLFNIDRCLVYAIIHTETNFVSDLFLQRNNPAGLMDNAKYCTFSSKEEGFIELCTEIRKYNERGAWTLEEMAQIHCEGNPKWAPTVREVYETVKSKENEIFANSNLVLNKAS